MILYEYPFNERIRTYLRIEQLCNRLALLIERDTAIDHHYALSTMFEIMDVGARADLKSDVLRDLEKQKQILHGYRGNPAISVDALEQFIGQLDARFSSLNGLPGKVGQSLTENDWLMSIRSRVGIPGGTCEFDLPSYYAWQKGEVIARREDLRQWCSKLAPLSAAVQILLQIIRDSGAAQKVIAIAGQFQQNLPQGKSFQLLRMKLDHGLGLIPEISGNRLIVSIRMMRLESDQRLHHAAVDTAFDLTFCS